MKKLAHSPNLTGGTSTLSEIMDIDGLKSTSSIPFPIDLPFSVILRTFPINYNTKHLRQKLLQKVNIYIFNNLFGISHRLLKN